LKLICSALVPVLPGDWTAKLAAGSGTWTVHGARPHSKSPLGMPVVGTAVQAADVEVAVGVVKPEQVGPHLQAEMYRSGVWPQAEVARAG